MYCLPVLRKTHLSVPWPNGRSGPRAPDADRHSPGSSAGRRECAFPGSLSGALASRKRSRRGIACLPDGSPTNTGRDAAGRLSFAAGHYLLMSGTVNDALREGPGMSHVLVLRARSMAGSSVRMPPRPWLRRRLRGRLHYGNDVLLSLWHRKLLHRWL